jgi:hypothetical protein
MMGGAVGLAVLASLADAHTEGLAADGVGRLDALTGGYHAAFVVAAVFAVGAAVGALRLPRRTDPQLSPDTSDALSAPAAVD